MAADATSVVLPPIVSAVGAYTVVLLGVDHQTLFAAFCGASLGLLFSITIGRWKAMAVFPFVVILAAELGTWAAAAWFDGQPHARKGMAGLLALFAHPLMAIAIKRLEPAFDALLRKIGVDL